MPARKLKRKQKPKTPLVAIVGNHSCAHGEPTNVKGEQPTFCIHCTKAVRATGHKCWRHEKALPYEELVAQQKAEDEEAERLKTFAERMHAKSQKKAKIREAVAELTPDERADLKQRELAIKAIRKAQKLRKKLGLSKKHK